MISTILTKQTGITAAGNSRSAPFKLQNASDITLHIVVTNTGTGTLTPALEDSPDGANFATAKTLTGITATGVYRASFADMGQALAQWAALSWTVSGASPSFDFTAYLTYRPA